MADFVLPNELSDALKDNRKLDPSENKNPIGQGKTLADLRKDAQSNIIKTNNPASAQSNLSDIKSIAPIQVNHAVNLIKILSNSFSNHRERISAENKIRAYFNGLEK